MFAPILSRSGFVKPYRDPAAVGLALADPLAQVLPVSPTGKVPLDAAGTGLRWLSGPTESDIYLGRSLAALSAGADSFDLGVDDAAAGRLSARPPLGQAGGNVGHQNLENRPLFVRMVAQEGPDWAGLADVAQQLGAVDCAAAVAGCALAAFHTSHGFCPSCGRPSQMSEQGWARRCTGCGAAVFPRVDPAIIVALLDQDDRLLLASGPRHRPGWRSVIAGFVDPGESLESTVRREAREEVGLEVTSLSYVTSQPWPFPRSLMLAFTARVTGQVAVDGVEVTQADFYTRAQVRALTASGQLRLPRGASVARLLIESWLAEQC
ncbi:NAD(+) diphosphatase [Buchananella felis]|uniref:NAD(+) diphosphatase n=1 Tax=Buchananella felis TaxID=3231492 RepID=UPI00352721E4